LSGARRQKRPVLAIGTTVVRALEDAAEKNNGSIEPIAPGKSETQIFLYPGKPFRIVDQLLTNFHLPRSSLLALVAGFAGRENVLRAYRHAVDAEYRFYSYGDAMLIR
jgi:S-adenosylmethionine:tRNA ribosyltransferase-isomerase